MASHPLCGTKGCGFPAKETVHRSAAAEQLSRKLLGLIVPPLMHHCTGHTASVFNCNRDYPEMPCALQCAVHSVQCAVCSICSGKPWRARWLDGQQNRQFMAPSLPLVGRGCSAVVREIIRESFLRLGHISSSTEREVAVYGRHHCHWRQH